MHALLAGLLVAACAASARAGITDADRLNAQRDAYLERPRGNAADPPFLLQSSEESDLVSGEVYARAEYALGELAESLSDPRQWCDLLLLHPNTARCAVDGEVDEPKLELEVTRRIDSPETHHLAFSLRAAASTPAYFGADLAAEHGPMATSDYRIRVEAVPVDDKSLFLHLRYSYRVAWSTRLALKMWLATLGRDCVGFTPAGVSRRGEVEYIRGMRGSAERNVMRYFLAIANAAWVSGWKTWRAIRASWRTRKSRRISK
ncbi:MAG TPA: hypothetical protein VHE37_05815 [Nevskiaceae bacterium]|nr:hypothetical protein [Nevskiaceae bacterium]